MKSQLTLLAASIIFAFGATAQAAQDQDKQRISDEHKSDVQKCNDMKGNQKKVCKAEADSKQTAEAELKAKQENTPKNQYELQKAKAEGEYRVAKAKCGDQIGDAKKTCEKQARADRDKALAQSKRETEKQGSSGESAKGGSSNSQSASGSSIQEQATPQKSQ